MIDCCCCCWYYYYYLPYSIPLPSLLPLPSFLLHLVPSLILLSIPPVFPFSFPCPYLYPLNLVRESGGTALPQWSSPGAKRLWCIFRLKSACFFHLHNDTFVILLYILAVYNGDGCFFNLGNKWRKGKPMYSQLKSLNATMLDGKRVEPIGVGDGGRGGHVPPPSKKRKKNRENILWEIIV